ncbi:MAG TPA: TonB family protein [Longimicrobium sp.]|nr:TonB family protein [Longimicrobium sp.]
MFNVLVGTRKRRMWSPVTVAVSVGAHVLLFGGFLAASATDSAAAPDVTEIPIDAFPAAPREVEPTPPPPAPEPATPEPTVPAVEGRTVVIEPPAEVPTEIPAVNPREQALTAEMTSGEGPVGNVYNPNAESHGETTVRAGTPEPAPPSGPRSSSEVDVLPDITNRSEIERFLRNNYPPLLRDAGVAGRVTVTLIIDENGRVEPGSVSVIDASSDGFRAPSIRAAERFRFRPARLGGRPVSVLISVPIEWKLQN